MSALPLHADSSPDDPKLELIHDPITKTISEWARRTGIADGTHGEAILELVIDTTNGNIRRSSVTRKGGADYLDSLTSVRPTR